MAGLLRSRAAPQSPAGSPLTCRTSAATAAAVTTRARRLTHCAATSFPRRRAPAKRHSASSGKTAYRNSGVGLITPVAANFFATARWYVMASGAVGG